MQQYSPYLNPNWPDAVWDVSGAFVNDRELIAFHDFCTLLLGFSPYNIAHGAPLCTWNSGRVLQHLIRSAEEIRAAGLEYEKRKIALYYTFTNLCLKSEHMNDPLGNAMLTFATNHNPTGRNAVIMASDTLLEHVRTNYPKLRTVSSILKITNGCRSIGTLLTHPKHSVLALNTPEITRLRKMGFRHFKMQGRGHANASSILFDLLRLVLRNDAPDENAMHATGQRFWESILPHEPS